MCLQWCFMDRLWAKWNESPVRPKTCLLAERLKLTCAFTVTGTKWQFQTDAWYDNILVASLVFPSHHILSLLSACDNKPALTPSATPAAQCGSTHPTGPPPLQRQLHPSSPQLTSGCLPRHVPPMSPSHHHSLTPASHNQQFALPRPHVTGPGAAFSGEQRLRSDYNLFFIMTMVSHAHGIHLIGASQTPSAPECGSDGSLHSKSQTTHYPPYCTSLSITLL